MRTPIAALGATACTLLLGLSLGVLADVPPERAWQRADKYVGPDFDGYFPDDADAGKRLDELYGWVRAGRSDNTDAQIIDAFRRGLRRSTQFKSHLLGALGNRYIWNQKDQNPDAVELMYHAIGSPDPQIRYNAVYYGLSVVHRKTPNILRALVELCLAGQTPDDSYGRIKWGCRDQLDEMAAIAREYRGKGDEVTRQGAVELERDLRGDGDFNRWVWGERLRVARERHAALLPDLRKRLLHGDNEARFKAFDEFRADFDRVLAMDEAFIEVLAAAAGDADARVRLRAVEHFSYRWVSPHEPQREDVLRMLTDLTDDPDLQVRQASVLRGLMGLRPRPDAATHTILQSLFNERKWISAYHGHVAQQMIHEKHRVVPMIRGFLDRLDTSETARAMIAMRLYREIGSEPYPDADRFLSRPGTTGQIAGVVLDAQSRPVGGATVLIADQRTGLLLLADTRRPVSIGGLSNDSSLLSAATDAEGRFTFESLPLGEYHLFAQSWHGAQAKWEGTLPPTSEVVRLHGVANGVKVEPDKTTGITIKPLGNGVLKVEAGPPDTRGYLFISTEPMLGDPVLSFLAWGPQFLGRVAVFCTTGATIEGLPTNTRVHLAVFVNDNSPGFGGASFNVPGPGAVTPTLKIPIIASWSDGHHTPPPRIAKVIEVIEAHEKALQPPRKLRKEDLLGAVPRPVDEDRFETYRRWVEFLSVGDQTVKLPNVESATRAEVMAAFAYRDLIAFHKERKGAAVR